MEEELQFPNSLFDDPLEPEIQLDIKTEPEHGGDDEIVTQDNLPELSQDSTPKKQNLFVNINLLKCLESNHHLCILENCASTVINTFTSSLLRST